MVLYGHASRGFEYPLVKFAVMTETDIFGQEQKKKKKRKKYNGNHIQDFSELSIGDYVVHEKHGLGIYRGIEKVEVDTDRQGLYKDSSETEATCIFWLLSWMPYRNTPAQMQTGSLS